MVNNHPANTGDAGEQVPSLGSDRGNGISFQYSCRKIPWIEEPGGPQSMGSQGVGHD